MDTSFGVLPKQPLRTHHTMQKNKHTLLEALESIIAGIDGGFGTNPKRLIEQIRAIAKRAVYIARDCGTEADARLMDAAPELLDALRLAEQLAATSRDVEACLPPDEDGWVFPVSKAAALKQIRAAIAKAEGETK